MWYEGQYKTKPYKDINKYFLENLKGELDDKTAKITLYEFLRNNVGFTIEMLCGIKLAPYQEITIRGMLNRNYSMCVWGRGCAKTFIASIFCIMQALFYPNSKILIAGPTFRTARFIFNKIEELVKRKDAVLLRQAFGQNITKRNDIHEWKLDNGSTITAIPLNGEKIRGFRANVLLIDEYLLMSREIIDTVLIPFLTAPQDMDERMSIMEIENKMVQQRLMKEEERTVFENKTKFIALSSASYTFENLYVTYSDWIKKINTPEEGSEATYFISQLAWDSIPKHMINKSVIEEAESGGTSNAIFLREYCANFTDGSEGYFSGKKMYACTIPDGEEPTCKIKGDSDKKYILAIDPSFSKAPNSDDFAMCVIELDEQSKQGIIVNSYAEHGKDLKDHILYFYYLLTNFNITLICIDNAGYQFIDAANEHELFIDNKINIKFIDFESSKEGVDRQEEIRRLKRELNCTIGKIAYKQVFSSNDFIRKSNEYLQGLIDYKKIWFASKAQARASSFDKMINTHLDMALINIKNVESKGDFVEHIGYNVDLIKKQCALIEVKSNARGTQNFDLPQHLNRETGEDRARRDSYTALLLGCWAMKSYYEMTEHKEENQETFVPFLI